MPDLIFPLEKRITTYLQGYRRFDARRSNGRRKHAGCDLVVAAGTPVLAVADGEVVRGPYHFYSGTYALEVEHRYASRTIMVRYGEIRQRVPRDIRPGAKVRQGDVIGFVGQLNSGSHMLHLEMYKDGSDHSSLTVFGLNKYKRRADVMDPTPLLDGAPTLAQSSIASASLPAHPPRPEPTPGRLSNLVGADDLVNVRQAARLVQGEAPLFRLRPSDEFTVLESVAGGRYPYGRGSLWLKIEHGGQTGYVVAHFVDTDFRIPPAVLVPEDSETGFVRDIDGPLNVRGAPSTDAGILGALSAGDSVEVLSEAIGGMYGSGRTDWLEINAAGLDQPGYVAAYYIDIGDDRRTRSDEPQTQRADMSR